jgi:putative SOS response-associated peptidase YedK
MAKAVATYQGGIHGQVQVAVREDGAVFRRYQNRTIYGYRWGAWTKGETVDATNPPETFINARRTNEYNQFNARLPA